jgi:hypothetical protein
MNTFSLFDQTKRKKGEERKVEDSGPSSYQSKEEPEKKGKGKGERERKRQEVEKEIS